MTCAETLARSLRDAGITRMFGLPGGEILDFVEAARKLGIDFTLVRHEATASFLADALGQLERRPAVCVSTLGPGAVNMTLGVANAFLDRSPLIAITASIAEASRPYATHQNLDLNAVYRPFTKMTITLDGTDTAAKARRAIRAAVEPRMGPVHLALPSDVGRREERVTEEASRIEVVPAPAAAPPASEAARMADVLRRARRPILLIGLDLDPLTAPPLVRRLVDALGVPAFVTPKAKGILPEDHPLFGGVCAGVAGDAVLLDFFARADLLVGLGFEPVESDKIWHQTMGIVSIGPLSVSAGAFAPRCELVGEFGASVEALLGASLGPYDWTPEDLRQLRANLEGVLRPAARPAGGLSPYELTRALRDLCPRETVMTTDVGSVKFVVSQAWTTFEPLTFLESNGLSSMGYSFPAAMAAKIRFPDRPVVCTVGDGGFAMGFADLETCVRRRLNVLTVVFNDSALSLIRVVQAGRRYPDHGVRFGRVDFAAAATALGAWGRRVSSLEELARAVPEAFGQDRPAVLDVAVDPAEYAAHVFERKGPGAA
jgi:acetolactate synthase-1/2/3 large subunit